MKVKDGYFSYAGYPVHAFRILLLSRPKRLRNVKRFSHLTVNLAKAQNSANKHSMVHMQVVRTLMIPKLDYNTHSCDTSVVQQASPSSLAETSTPL